jgi:hypothetical protein
MLNDEFFFKKRNTQKDPSKFKLTHQTHDLSHETKIAILKVNWNNHETQFSINPMLKDKIEKKNQLKKNLSQPRSTHQIRDPGHRTEITS